MRRLCCNDVRQQRKHTGSCCASIQLSLGKLLKDFCHFLPPPQVNILEKVLLASSFLTRCSREGGCTKLSAESSMNGRTAMLCIVPHRASIYEVLKDL